MLEQSATKLKNIGISTLVAVLIIALISLSISKCVSDKRNKKLQNDLATTIYNGNMLFNEVKEKNEVVVTQKQLLVEKDNEIVKRIKSEEHLRSLNSQVVTKTVVQIKEIKVPYIDSTVIITQVDSATKDTTEYLKLPSRAQVITKHYEIDETVTADGIQVNEISIPDSITLVIGESGNIFNSESIVRISHDNPFIKTTMMKNIVVKPKVSKPVKTFLIGGGVGIAVGGILTGLLFHYVK